MPVPELNATACGWELDVLWRHERVALEFDSEALAGNGGAGELRPAA